MPDRSERDPRNPLRPAHELQAMPLAERRRVAFAAARVAAHADRELYFLDLAVRAPDDDSARRLELYADAAYRDAVAMAIEHDLDCS